MDIRKIKLLLNTLKYLKPIQVYYRFYYFFRNRIFSKEAKRKDIHEHNEIQWKSNIVNSTSYKESSCSFHFLNIEHRFSNKIDWNYAGYGKLWTYNLNYFDFLHQEEMTKEMGLNLISDYLKNDSILIDGKEPYPISLRGINWVKFLSEHKVKDHQIDEVLYNHYRTLLKNLEYHLLGNHLLENAFSLLFGAYYFQDETLYKTSKRLLVSELNEQILEDGAHYELSPMYHQILFSRLLDCIQLIQLNTTWKNDELLSFLEKKATLMNSWLKNITYKNGDIPMVNDATYNIAPESSALFGYFEKLSILSKQISLSESGYRKIVLDQYELFIDVGNVGPLYQPGHAHSDTYNFELIKKGKPVFVDRGISTYEKNAVRQVERSTSSHNTVQIGSQEQTQVWGGFRVAERAEIVDLKEEKNVIKSGHDGYKKSGFMHQRVFHWEENKIILEDKISASTNDTSRAFFHLHNSIEKPIIKRSKVLLNDRKISIEFENCSNVEIGKYELSKGFNKTESAYKIIVTFDQNLVTTISI